MRNLFYVVTFIIAMFSSAVFASWEKPSSYNPGGLNGAYRIEIYDPTKNNKVVYAYSFTKSHQAAKPCSKFNYTLNRTYRVRLIGRLHKGKNYFDTKRSFERSSSTLTHIFALGSTNEPNVRPAGYFTRDVQFEDKRAERFSIHGSLNGQGFRFTIPLKFSY